MTDSPNAPAAVNRTEHTTQAQITELKDHIRRSDKWMIALTAAIATITLGSAVVALLQWWVMKGQLKEMRDGSADTHTLAIASQTQATAAQSAAETAKSSAGNTLTEMQKQSQAMQREADAAKRAANTSAQQLDMAERPWVSLDLVLNGPAVFDQDGLRLNLKVTLKNTGSSPAIAVMMEPRFFIEAQKLGQDLEVRDKQEALCDDMKKRALINLRLLPTLFPGSDPIPTNWPLSISKVDMDAAGRGAIPVIISCVVYRSTFNDIFHKTTYSSHVLASTLMVNESHAD